MKLRSYQEEGAKRIFDHYQSGAGLALVQMTQGSGKVLTARVALERIAAKEGGIAVAWVDSFSGTLAGGASEVDASAKLNITHLKFTELLSRIRSGAITPDFFDVIVLFDPYSILNDLEGVASWFSGFLLIFSSVPSQHAFFMDNWRNAVYQYTLDEALLDGAALSVALETGLKELNAQVEGGSSIVDLSEGLKGAEAKSAELRHMISLILQGKVSYQDILDIQKKKAELRDFGRLLTDEAYFQRHVEEKTGPESVWQCFFQRNQWIFGFGLNYIFNTPLPDGKLEKVVSGHSVTDSGKRVDALLRSNGVVSSLCFAEIKTHKASLLRQVKTGYRPGAWAISDELAGAIAQVQRTVQVSMKNIQTSLEVKDGEGYGSGERLYLYKPKSFLVIGALSEFANEAGYINEA